MEGKKNSTIVFTGTVLEKVRVNPIEISPDYREYKVKFWVRRYWKGVLPKEFTVRTAESTKACGFDFKKDESYLVYAVGGTEPLVTLCSRTILLSSKQAEADARVFGPGTVPKE